MQKRGVHVLPARGHAAGTVPLQTFQPSIAPMRRFGASVLCAGLAALAAITVFRLLEKPRVTAAEPSE